HSSPASHTQLPQTFGTNTVVDVVDNEVEVDVELDVLVAVGSRLPSLLGSTSTPASTITSMTSPCFAGSSGSGGSAAIFSFTRSIAMLEFGDDFITGLIASSVAVLATNSARSWTSSMLVGDSLVVAARGSRLFARIDASAVFPGRSRRSSLVNACVAGSQALTMLDAAFSSML